VSLKSFRLIFCALRYLDENLPIFCALRYLDKNLPVREQLWSIAREGVKFEEKNPPQKEQKDQQRNDGGGGGMDCRNSTYLTPRISVQISTKYLRRVLNLMR
jgi:hypothetical protein